MLGHRLAHSDPIVERFEAWARHRLDKGFSLAEAATAVGASKRTLTRNMEHAIGKSPLADFQQLRVERAVHLLETEAYRVDSVAVKVGDANAAALRTLLRRKLDVGVKDLRRPMTGDQGLPTRAECRRRSCRAGRRPWIERGARGWVRSIRPRHALAVA